jgi:H+/Cl- antiporter ClcA
MASDWDVDEGSFWGIAIAIVVVAALAAAAVFMLADAFSEDAIVVGIDEAQVLDIWNVIMVAAFFAFLGMLVFRLLLALVPAGDIFYTVIGTLFLLVSLIVIARVDASSGNSVWLIGMHLATYIVAVPVANSMLGRMATRKPKFPPPSAPTASMPPPPPTV